MSDILDTDRELYRAMREAPKRFEEAANRYYESLPLNTVWTPDILDKSDQAEREMKDAETAWHQSAAKFLDFRRRNLQQLRVAGQDRRHV